ncbi:MAG: hypothetical protein FWC42_00015 [Proteobacteria bacterium]|nr:hypothetical protein [Pseudomonadota bacterium]
MALDSQTLDALKWLGAGIGWLASAYISYRIGRRAKIDDIQIEKRQTFVDQLSNLLQTDFHERQQIVDLYNLNFSHMKNLSEAMYYFDKYESLYQEFRQLMSKLPEGIDKLQEVNRNAAIYLDKNTVEAIESYISDTLFSYDDTGLTDTYAENFFTTVLDDDRSKRLAENYEAAMHGLRKAVRWR